MHKGLSAQCPLCKHTIRDGTTEAGDRFRLSRQHPPSEASCSHSVEMPVLGDGPADTEAPSAEQVVAIRSSTEGGSSGGAATLRSELSAININAGLAAADAAGAADAADAAESEAASPAVASVSAGQHPPSARLAPSTLEQDAELGGQDAQLGGQTFRLPGDDASSSSSRSSSPHLSPVHSPRQVVIEPCNDAATPRQTGQLIQSRIYAPGLGGSNSPE